MTRPIQVTEEMRQAVYAADCVAKGHIPQLNVVQAVVADDGVSRLDIYGGDQIANVTCQRCGKVWLVVEDPGVTYDDAVARLKARMIDPSTVKPRTPPVTPTR